MTTLEIILLSVAVLLATSLIAISNKSADKEKRRNQYYTDRELSVYKQEREIAIDRAYEKKKQELQEGNNLDRVNNNRTILYTEKDIMELKLKRDALKLEVGLYESIHLMREECARLEAKRESMKRELLQTQEENTFLRGVVNEFAKGPKS